RYSARKQRRTESGRFFRGANRAVLPEPIDEANRCNLRHVTPKTLQKALYVGFSQIGRPPQVVCLGWSQFPAPEARHLVAERVAVLEPQPFHDHQHQHQPDAQLLCSAPVSVTANGSQPAPRVSTVRTGTGTTPAGEALSITPQASRPHSFIA